MLTKTEMKTIVHKIQMYIMMCIYLFIGFSFMIGLVIFGVFGCIIGYTIKACRYIMGIESNRNVTI